MDDELDLMGLNTHEQAVASDTLAVVRQRLGRLEVTGDPACDNDWRDQIATTLDIIENEAYGR